VSNMGQRPAGPPPVPPRDPWRCDVRPGAGPGASLTPRRSMAPRAPWACKGSHPVSRFWWGHPRQKHIGATPGAGGQASGVMCPPDSLPSTPHNRISPLAGKRAILGGRTSPGPCPGGRRWIIFHGDPRRLMTGRHGPLRLRDGATRDACSPRSRALRRTVLIQAGLIPAVAVAHGEGQGPSAPRAPPMAPGERPPPRHHRVGDRHARTRSKLRRQRRATRSSDP